MLVDTDVIIWALRGNKRATTVIDQADSLKLSVVSYMELLQGARDKTDLRLTKAFLTDLGFAIVPLSENIGHRATIYLEEYALKSNLGVPDALIAATAAENELTLCTGNAKDYRAIEELALKAFRP
ncbi:MAG TPA: type II toxin-antitoxin system VapC family toxin [Candidatus Hydrogenedentes bacterium]|nr:type II toxin-antitoxin system VapC family toxin [Candidatus Hydrogenedentota bacterium]HOS02654.1 type II toxin-antitoxin system VapC family toxin [Candidatus Hydrogenedentota bacterium]